MATKKQQKVLENIASDKSKKEILKEAGYSKAVQNNPAKVFSSKTIVNALASSGITDEYLAKKQKKHLEAKKIGYRDFFEFWEKNKDSWKEIQDILDEDIEGATLLSLEEREAKGGISYLTAKFSMPDYHIQDKALDKVYKITSAYAPEKIEHTGNFSLKDLFSSEKKEK